MNRLHRLGRSLFHVGGTGAGICFMALMYSFALPDVFWWAFGAVALCGVVAGVGYVLEHTFDDPPPPASGEPPRPEP